MKIWKTNLRGNSEIFQGDSQISFQFRNDFANFVLKFPNFLLKFHNFLFCSVHCHWLTNNPPKAGARGTEQEVRNFQMEVRKVVGNSKEISLKDLQISLTRFPSFPGNQLNQEHKIGT